jgi:hypothetical protein
MDIKLFSNIQDTFRYNPTVERDPLFYNATQQGFAYMMDSALSDDQRKSVRLLPNFETRAIADPTNWSKIPNVFKSNDELLTSQQYYNAVSGAMSSLVTTPDQTAFIRSVLQPNQNAYRTQEYGPEKFNRKYISSLQDELAVLNTNPESEENNRKMAEKIHEIATISSQLNQTEAEFEAMKESDAFRVSMYLDAADTWGTEFAGWLAEDFPLIGTGYEGEGSGKDVFTKSTEDITRILEETDPNFDGVSWFNNTFQNETVKMGLSQYGITEDTFTNIKNVNKAKVIIANALLNTEMQRKIQQYSANLSGWRSAQNMVLDLGYSIFNTPDTVELAVDSLALIAASGLLKLGGTVLTATGLGAPVGIPTVAGSVALDAAAAARVATLGSRIRNILGYATEAVPKFILNDVPSFGKAWGLGGRAAWMFGGGAVYGAAASLSTQQQNIRISELANFTNPGSQRELDYSRAGMEGLISGSFTAGFSLGLTGTGAVLNKYLTPNSFQESRQIVSRTKSWWGDKLGKKVQVTSEGMPPVERAVAEAVVEGKEPTPERIVENIAETNRVAEAREISGTSEAAASATTNRAINRLEGESLESVVKRSVRGNALNSYQDAQKLAMAELGETDFSRLSPKQQADVLVRTQRVIFLAEREAIKQGNGSIDPRMSAFIDNSKKQLKANVSGVRKNFTPEQREIFEETLKAASKSEKRFRYALNKSQTFSELFTKLSIEIPVVKVGRAYKAVTKPLTDSAVAQAIRQGDVTLGFNSVKETLYQLAGISDTLQDRLSKLNQRRLAVAEKLKDSPELQETLAKIDEDIAKTTEALDVANKNLESNSIAAQQLLVDLEARRADMTPEAVNKAIETAQRIKDALDSVEAKGAEQAKEELKEAISEVVPAAEVDEVAETVVASRILDNGDDADNLLAEVTGAKVSTIRSKLKRMFNATRANFTKATREAKREVYTAENSKAAFLKHAVAFWGKEAEEIASSLHKRLSIFTKAGVLNDKEFRFLLAMMLDMPLNSDRLKKVSFKLEKLGDSILGDFDPVLNKVKINTLNKKEVLNTIMHEIGHALEGTNFLSQKIIAKAYNETNLDSILAGINELRKVLGIKRKAAEYSVSDMNEAFAELFSLFMMVENKAQLDYLEQTMDRSITSLLTKVGQQVYYLVSNTVRDLGIDAVALTYSKAIKDVIKAVENNTNTIAEYTLGQSFITTLEVARLNKSDTTKQVLIDFIAENFKTSKEQALKLATEASEIIDTVSGIGIKQNGEMDASYAQALLTTVEELKAVAFTKEKFKAKFIENFRIYNKTHLKQADRYVANQMRIVDNILNNKNLTLDNKKKILAVLQTLLEDQTTHNTLYTYLTKQDSIFGATTGLWSDEVDNILKEITYTKEELETISEALYSAMTAVNYYKGHVLGTNRAMFSLAGRAKIVYGLQREIIKRELQLNKTKFSGLDPNIKFFEMSYPDQQNSIALLEQGLDNGLTVDQIINFMGVSEGTAASLKQTLKTPEQALVYLSDFSDFTFVEDTYRLLYDEASPEVLEIAQQLSQEFYNIMDSGIKASKDIPEQIEGVPLQKDLQNPVYKEDIVGGLYNLLTIPLIKSVLRKKTNNNAEEVRQLIAAELLRQQEKKGVKSELQSEILLISQTGLSKEEKIKFAFDRVKSKLKTFVGEVESAEKKAQFGGPVTETRQALDREVAMTEATQRGTTEQRVPTKVKRLKFIWETVKGKEAAFSLNVYNALLSKEIDGITFGELFPELDLTKNMSLDEKELFAKLNDIDILYSLVELKRKEGLVDGKENPTIKDFIKYVLKEEDPKKVESLVNKIDRLKKKAKSQIKTAVEIWQRVSDGSEISPAKLEVELNNRVTKPLTVNEQAPVVNSLAASETAPTSATITEPVAVPEKATLPLPYKATDNVKEDSLHIVGSWDGSGEIPVGSVLLTQVDSNVAKNTKPGANVVSLNIKTQTSLTLKYNTKKGVLSVEGDMPNKTKFLISLGLERGVKHMLVANVQNTYEALVSNINKISELNYDSVRIVDETGRVRAILLTKPQKPEVIRVFKIEEPAVEAPKPVVKPEVKPAIEPKVEPAKDISDLVTVVRTEETKPKPVVEGTLKTPIRLPKSEPTVETVAETNTVELSPDEEVAQLVKDKVGNRARGVDPDEILTVVKEAGKLFKKAKNVLKYALTETDFINVRNRILDMYIAVNEYVTTLNENNFGSQFEAANKLFWTKVDNILAEQKLKSVDAGSVFLPNMRSIYKQAAEEVSKSFKKEFVAPVALREFKQRRIKVIKTETGETVEFGFDVSKERQFIIDAVNGEQGVPDPSALPSAPEPAVAGAAPVTPAIPESAAVTPPLPEEIPATTLPDEMSPLEEALAEAVAREGATHLARENNWLMSFFFGGSERASRNWWRRFMRMNTGITQLSTNMNNTIRSLSSTVRHVSRFADNTRLQTGTLVAPGQAATITWREANSIATNALHPLIHTTQRARSYVVGIGKENMAKLEQALAVSRFAGKPMTAAEVVKAVPNIGSFKAYGRVGAKETINPEVVANLLNNINAEQTKLYKKILDLQVETGNLQIIDDLGTAVNPENYFPILFDADKLSKAYIEDPAIRGLLKAALIKARQRTKLASRTVDTNTAVALGWLEVEVVEGTGLTRDRKILGTRLAANRLDPETLQKLNPRVYLKSNIPDIDSFKKNQTMSGYMYGETSDRIVIYDLPKTVDQLSSNDLRKYYATINGDTQYYADTELVRGLFGRKAVIDVEMDKLIEFKTNEGEFASGRNVIEENGRPMLSVTTREGKFMLDVRNITPDEVMNEPLVAQFVKTNPLEVSNLFARGRLFELTVQKELLKKYGLKGLTINKYLEVMERLANRDLDSIVRNNAKLRAKAATLRSNIKDGFTRLHEEYASYTGALRLLKTSNEEGRLARIAQDIVRYKTSWGYGVAAMAVEGTSELIRSPIRAIPNILNGINFLVGPKRFKMDAMLKSEVGDLAFVIDDLQADLGSRYLSDTYDGALTTNSTLSKIAQRNEQISTVENAVGTAANVATEVGSLSAVDRFTRSMSKTRLSRQFIEDLRAGRLLKLLSALQDPVVATDLQRLFNLSNESSREAAKLIKRWKGVARQAGFPFDPTRAAIYNQYGLLNPDFMKAMKFLIDKSGSADGRINFIELEKIALAAGDNAPVSKEVMVDALNRFRYFLEDQITKQSSSRQVGLNRALGVSSRTTIGKLTQMLTGWLRSYQDNVIMDYTNRSPLKYFADTVLLAGGLGAIYSYLREVLSGRDVSDVIEEVENNPSSFAIRATREMNLLGIGNAAIEAPLSVLSEISGGTWKFYGGATTTPGLDVLGSSIKDVKKIYEGIGDIGSGNVAQGAAKTLSPLIAPPVNKGFTAIPVKSMELMLQLDRQNQLQIFLDALRSSKKAPYGRRMPTQPVAPVEAPKPRKKDYYELREQYRKSRVIAPKMDLNSQFNIKGVSSDLADILGKLKIS